MITRQQRFWDGHTERLTFTHQGVSFTNVPASEPIHDRGDFALLIGLWEVLDELVEQIPLAIRPAITIDLAHLDIWEQMEQLIERERGHRLPDEYVISETSVAAEVKILKVQFNEEVDPSKNYAGIRVVTETEWQQYLRGEWPPEEGDKDAD
jgi:hypothetical protein